MNSVRVISQSVCVAVVLAASSWQPVHAVDWENLWSSAEQRAAKQLEARQYDKLIESAPTPNWRGLGEYRKGDFTAAARSFAEQREAAEQSGLPDQSTQATYNQANAHVHEENYEQAIELYDDVLNSNPQHERAKHNRDIAQQLLELQQQSEQQQESGEQGDKKDADGQQQSDQQQQQSGDGENADQQNDQQSQDQQNEQNSDQQNSDNTAENGGESTQSEPESERQRLAQEEAAARAMQAEQQRENDAQPNQNGTPAESDQLPSAPLSEREQANEQWLRKIPDDPAGLLQRKLQNRHLTDFPKVQDSDKPW